MQDPRLVTLSFESPVEFRAWLSKNHSESVGIWLRIYKKAASELSVTYAQALDQALCYGWIDGQKQKFDQDSWLQRFTPRRPRSGWSKINTQHSERLMKSGEMTPAGLKAIEDAKLDGRWEAAYGSSRNVELPDDFLAELNKNKRASAIVYRLQTARKPETRKKRIDQFVAMLERSEKLHL